MSGRFDDPDEAFRSRRGAGHDTRSYPALSTADLAESLAEDLERAYRGLSALAGASLAPGAARIELRAPAAWAALHRAALDPGVPGTSYTSATDPRDVPLIQCGGVLIEPGGELLANLRKSLRTGRPHRSLVGDAPSGKEYVETVEVPVPPRFQVHPDAELDSLARAVQRDALTREEGAALYRDLGLQHSPVPAEWRPVPDPGEE